MVESQGDPGAPNPLDQERQPWLGTSFKRIAILVGILGACIVVAALVCQAPRVASEFAPPTPAPTPTVAPTWTPVPTYTPVPLPTATPQAMADLPIQQLHYDEYRIFHLLYEYEQCVKTYVKPPPTPTPAPSPRPQLEYTGQYPDEPWRDDERFNYLRPTQTPLPTKVPGAFALHRPPVYGLTPREIEDHVIDDIGGATRWLIARYRDGSCVELTQYTVFPGRLTWLHRYSAKE